MKWTLRLPLPSTRTEMTNMNQMIRVRRTPPKLAPTPGGLASAYRAMNTETPAGGLQIFSSVPGGHDICLAKDDRMGPLIRKSDIIVYEERNSLPETDQLFVIEYPGWTAGKPGGPTTREVVEVFSTLVKGDELWWSTSLRRPRTEADHIRLARQRVFHCSDGPYSYENMSLRLIGRVVGIYDPREIGNVHD
jgi:hypothetical protein